MISGRITRVGYYRDTLPQLVIVIRKEAAGLLPWRDNERMPVSLRIQGECYHAGIRTTPRSSTLTISPDLTDSTGTPARLTDLLFSGGFQNRRDVAISLEDGILSFA